jgi:thiamine-monophosphate kinase
MAGERDFIQSLRNIATNPAARGLVDDAAILEIGGKRLVLTHDMIVEGVHYLPSDPAEDVAWKLVAVNLSDLAAKGAVPLGILVGYTLSREGAWDEAFVRGLAEAAAAFSVPLLGGDTVALPNGSARVLGLTAIGESDAAPSRSGARPGDLLWVTGTIGDGGLGLEIAVRGQHEPAVPLRRYRRPIPRLHAGQALAPLVSAMMDVSDGLLIDASRMGEASGAAIRIDLGRVPLSEPFAEAVGIDRAARLRATTSGDDYELLFAAPAAREEDIHAIAESLNLAVTPVGAVEEGHGLRIMHHGEDVPLPARLGYEHGSAL